MEQMKTGGDTATKEAPKLADDLAQQDANPTPSGPGFSMEYGSCGSQNREVEQIEQASQKTDLDAQKALVLRIFKKYKKENKEAVLKRMSEIRESVMNPDNNMPRMDAFKQYMHESDGNGKLEPTVYVHGRCMNLAERTGLAMDEGQISEVLVVDSACGSSGECYLVMRIE